MTTTPKKCPEKTTLADYLLGKLVEPHLGQCEAHVADCDLCEETMRGLNANDTLSQLTSLSLERTDDESSEDEQLINNLITQLQDVPHRSHRPQENLDSRAVEVTRLLAPPTSSEMIGTLAHYEVKQLIGAGSTGVVYRAFDQQLHRVVALKILRPSLGESARERFMAEARSAAAIAHPNVVTIFQVGIEGPLAYMAMEWIPGETLEERLGRVTVLSEQDVREIGIQIANGLAAANRKSLIHRDIKPANIWMDSEENRAIILDFGLARIADDDPQMTATGMLAGTPNFMSPEQTRGLELDGRSDLFSLGCLMYRASTGKLPFGSTGILATLQTIQKETPRLPRDLNPNLSDDFSDLVMCLLEKQPVDRPANAKQLSTALNEPRAKWPFKVSEYARAVEPKPKLSEKSWTRRPPPIRWAVAAILLIAIGWGAWLFSPQIIRIATNQGELIIDAKDAAVKVEITKNGEVVRIVDTRTDQHFDILAGEYNISLSDPRNGFELKPGHVVMTRGGKQIVTVTRTRIAPDSQDEQENPSFLKDIGLADSKYRRNGYVATELDLRILDARAELAKLQSTKGEIHPDVRAMEKYLDVMLAAKTELENAAAEEPPTPGLNSGLERELFDLGAYELDIKRKQRKIVEYENELERTRQLYERSYVTKEEVLKHQNQLDDAVDELEAAKRLLAYKQHELTEPRFEGYSFDHWLRILNTERSYGSLVTASIALGMLAEGNPSYQDKMFDALTPMIRKYGYKSIRGLNVSPDQYTERHLNGGFVMAMGHVDPQRLMEFVVDEIENGTDESRQFSSLLLSSGFVYSNRKGMQARHLAAMSNQSVQMATVLLAKIDATDSDERNTYSELLASLFYQLWRWEGHKLHSQPTPQMKETLRVQNALFIEKLKTAFQSDRTAIVAITGPILAKAAPETKGLALRLAQLLSDPTIDLSERISGYHGLVAIEPSYAKESVSVLVELAKRNGPKDKRLEARLHSEERGRRRNLSLPWQIVKLLTRFGKNAESALPWIQSLTPDDASEKVILREAIISIGGSENEDMGGPET